MVISFGLLLEMAKIPLWKELFEKFTKNKKDLPTS